MVLAIFILVAGLALLWFAADKLINSSVRIAKFFKLSPLFIGLTILAIWTSAPELFLSAMSALSGNWSISVWNIVWSNIFNLWFILGLSAIVAPILIQKKLVRRDWFFLVFITCLLLCFLWDQHVMWREWAILLALLVWYNWYLWIKQEPIEDDSDTEELPKIKNFLYIFGAILILSIMTLNIEDGFSISWWFSLYSSIFMWVIAILFAISMRLRRDKKWTESKMWMILNITKLIASIGLLVMSSDIIVDSAVYIAQTLWVSERAIWATIIAAGTSLPEVAATLAAIIKKKYDMWVWNVIGSDIFNILWIVWISSIITPLQLTPTCLIENCESWVLSYLMYDNLFSMAILIITLIITLIFMRTNRKLSKAEWICLFIFACLRMAFEIKPDFFIGLF